MTEVLSPFTPVNLYLEAHVTIEPVFDERRDQATEIAKRHGFKLAHLLMQKRSTDTPERSKHDTFMTGHSKTLHDIQTRLHSLIMDLKFNGFKVWRYKVEDTIFDSRHEDIFNEID